MPRLMALTMPAMIGRVIPHLHRLKSSRWLDECQPLLIRTKAGAINFMSQFSSAWLATYEARNGPNNLFPAQGVEREADLHAEIFDECRRRGWIALHGSMADRTCRTLGEPDFTILAEAGRVLFVECKTRTGKLSPAQNAMKFHADKLGHTIHVVRSMQEFLEILK